MLSNPAVRRELLEAPLADAAELTAGRLPVPRLVQTEHNGSQVRNIKPNCWFS
jgi:hypothetical protein